MNDMFSVFPRLTLALTNLNTVKRSDAYIRTIHYVIIVSGNHPGLLPVGYQAITRNNADIFSI